MSDSYQAKWKKLGIAKNDLLQLETYYRQVAGIRDDVGIEKLLDPDLFVSRTVALNKDLKNSGFDFPVDYREMLGIIADLEMVNRHNRKIGQPLATPVYIAVFRQVTKMIRKELGWNEQTGIPKEMMEKRMKLFIFQAKQKMGQNKI